MVYGPVTEWLLTIRLPDHSVNGQVKVCYLDVSGNRRVVNQMPTVSQLTSLLEIYQINAFH